MGSERVGRITTEGEIEEFPAPGMPSMITIGPDGALWFTLNQGNAIGRIETKARMTTAKAGDAKRRPGRDRRHARRRVWFTEILADALGGSRRAGRSRSCRCRRGRSRTR